MTVKRWSGTCMVWMLSIGLFFYVGHYKHYIWGMPVVALNLLTWFSMLVNTVDLLFGRWIRGTRQAVMQPSHRHPSVIRRVILEEVHYQEGGGYARR